MGGKVSTSSSIDYLTNISTETRTPIDRHKYTVMGKSGVYFIHQTSIFTYRSIDISTEEKNGGRETLVEKHTEGCIDRTNINDTSTGQTVARIDRTQYQQSQI